MNQLLIDLMGQHFLLHESENEQIETDREIMLKLNEAKNVDEWNGLIGLLSGLDLRASIETSGVINQILGRDK